MIIVYQKPNILSLPYEGRKYFDFKPGKNEILPEIWKAICEQAGSKKMEYYSTLLHVVQGETDPDTGIETGPDVVNITDLNVKDSLILIKGTTELAELEGYLKAENSQESPRKTVLDAIEKQAEQIKELEKKLKEDKEKSDN